MKITISGYISSKDTELYSDCADYCGINKENHRYAVSDGVGKSFFPRIWSEKLVETFVNQINLNEKDFIAPSQISWQQVLKEKVSEPDVRWYTIRQFERNEPAYATFVGLQFHEEAMEWSAFSLGDSFLFFVPNDYLDFNDDVIKLSTLKEPFTFDNYPDFYTSIGNDHKGIPPTQIKRNKLRNGHFYLMTDAMSEWFLNLRENAIEIINNWDSRADFINFITQARINETLKDDDSTILIISIEEDNSPKFNYNIKDLMNLPDLVYEEKLIKENPNSFQNNSNVLEDSKDNSQLFDDKKELFPEILGSPEIKEHKINELIEEPKKKGFKLKQFIFDLIQRLIILKKNLKKGLGRLPKSL